MTDFHVHSTFSDGKNSLEEMIEAAIAKGMTKLGFSDHSYTFFDESYCMPREKLSAYTDAVHSLREKYRGKIEIFCGVEQDLYSAEPTDPYDYAIGSVHYIKYENEYIPVDESPLTLITAADKLGGIYNVVEAYFENVAQVIEKTDADIIGHFDLVSVHNQRAMLFNEDDPRYISAAKKAIDKLLKYGRPFEINTGAISRGYRSIAYPAPRFMDYIADHGGRFVLGSDSHRTETLCFGFENFSKYHPISLK